MIGDLFINGAMFIHDNFVNLKIWKKNSYIYVLYARIAVHAVHYMYPVSHFKRPRDFFFVILPNIQMHL